MEALGVDALLDVAVKSFPTLQREVFGAGAGLKHRWITDIGRSLLLRLILAESELDEPVFPREVRGDGFLSRLMDELREFKEYGITPELLEEIADSVSGAAATRDKLLEIARIYRRYEELLGDMGDADDRMIFAASQIETADVFEGVDFFFDAFHSLSKLELDFMKALNAKGNPIDVAITIDPAAARLVAEDPEAAFGVLRARIDAAVDDAEAFTVSSRFLRSLALSLPGKRELVSARPLEREGAECFRHAAESVFSYRSGQIDGSNVPIRTRIYKNTAEEIDGVLAELRRAVIEEGVSYRDIQIILTDPGEYGGMLKRRLDYEKIPYFLDETRGLDIHPFVRFIKSALRVADKGFRADDVIEFAKSGFNGLSTESLERYENYVRRRKIERGMFLQKRYFTPDELYLQANPKNAERLRAEIENADAVNDRLKSLLIPLWESASEKRTVRQRAEDLFRFLYREEILREIDAYEEKLEQDPEGEERVRVQSQLWDEIVSMLEQAVEVGGDRKISFADFAVLMADGLDDLTVGIIPPYCDQVTVTGILRSRTRRRRRVFLVGMSDLYIPRSRKSFDILSQEEKELLEAKGFHLPSMKSFAVEEEQIAFYTILNNVGERLEISYARQSGKNEAMSESFWLSRILQGFRGLEPELADVSEPAMLAYSRSLRNVEIPKALREGDNGFAKSFLEAMLESENTRHDAEAIKAALDYSAVRKPLSPPMARRLYGNTDVVSASQIESFALCPYRYFVDYALRPQEDQERDIDALDVGNIIHDSMDALTAEIAQDPQAFPRIPEEERTKLVRGIFRAKTAENVEKSRKEIPKNGFILRLAEQTIREAEEVILRQIQNSDIERILHEQSFGRGRVFPGVAIDLGNRVIYIEGRIDRVDIAKDGSNALVRVVDYKTGSRTFEPYKVLEGTELQLTLYLRAASSSRDAVPAGCFYSPVTPPPLLDVNKVDVEREALKASNLDGVILDERRIYEHFDRSSNGGESLNESEVHRTKRRAGKGDWKWQNALPRPLMDRFLDDAVEVSRQLLIKRENGLISVQPLCRQKSGKSANVACEYCPYGSICRFEKDLDYGLHRFVDEVSWGEWRTKAIERLGERDVQNGKEGDDGR